MELSPAPIQELTTAPSGYFPQVWIRWFQSVRDSVLNSNFASISIPPVTNDITLGSANSTVICDASGGVITVTLPEVSSFAGFKYNIKKIDTSANNVTIDGDGANIDATATRLLSGSGRPSVTIHSDGTDWWII